MKKFIASLLLAVSMYIPVTASAEVLVGDVVKGGYIACKDKTVANMLFGAYVTGPKEAVLDIEAMYTALGICQAGYGQGTIAAVLKVDKDYEGDVIFMFHPVHRQTGEMIGSVYIISWDIFLNKLGRDAQDN